MPGGGTARVAINAGGTPTELDEQKGLANLVKGRLWGWCRGSRGGRGCSGSP
ncbi:hypothetical protein [Streptomyces sp. NPDC005498]|uniref:hypothetical protein n=1 Tax=Streptomyces sp. NPDC005498 TaxID=3364717 RepID=UPI0036BF2967